MQKAIDETERRRAKQIAFNQEHGITPKSASRSITDKIDTGDDETSEVVQIVFISSIGRRGWKHPPFTKTTGQRNRSLRKQMQALSRELKFEEAAKVRDTVIALKEPVSSIKLVKSIYHNNAFTV